MLAPAPRARAPSDGSAVVSGTGTSSTFRSEDEQIISKKLSKGRRALHRIRCRFVVFMLGVAIACLLLDWRARRNIFSIATQRKGGAGLASGWDTRWFVEAGFFIAIAHVVLAMAPLADSVHVTRCALVAQVLLLVPSATMRAKYLKFDLTVTLPSGECTSFEVEQPMFICHAWVISNLTRLTCTVLCMVGFIVAMAFRTPKQMQRWMWALIVCFLLGDLVGSAVAIASYFFEGARGEKPPPLLYQSLGQCAGLLFAVTPRIRLLAQRWLRGIFDARGTAMAAAGIAGLIGNCSSQEVLKQASARFRTISLAELSYFDLADNQPNPSLFERSLPSSKCDAFISHSWHDDPGAKWAALQRWRAVFLLAHGREPRLWIDKCCIDQNNIEADLRCLPIFLSKCSSFVVLCGDTYLRRLWCLVELFTFAHMGGQAAQVDFLAVAAEEAGPAAFRDALADFDARDAECFEPRDKERMLTIIETAYGSTQGFTAVVRDIVEETLVSQTAAPAAAIGNSVDNEV